MSKVIAAKLLAAGVVVGTAIVIKDAPIDDKGNVKDFMLSHHLEDGEDSSDAGIIASIKDAGIPPAFIIAMAAKSVDSLKDEYTLVELEEVGEVSFTDAE